MPLRQQIYNFYFFKTQTHKSLSSGLILSLKNSKVKFLKKETKNFYTIITTFWYYLPETFSEPLMITFKNFNKTQYTFLKSLMLGVDCNIKVIFIKKSYNKLLKISKRIKKKTLKKLLKLN